MRSEQELAAPFRDGKREILKDMGSGVVPMSVGYFSAIHDYKDANGYCGFLLGGDREDWDSPSIIEVQLRLDQWLRDRPNQAG